MFWVSSENLTLEQKRDEIKNEKNILDCWMSVWGLGTSAQMLDCILRFVRRYLHYCQNLPYIMSQLCGRDNTGRSPPAPSLLQALSAKPHVHCGFPS